MGITSFEFILFLVVAIVLFYLIPGRHRPYFLLIINMVFYSFFGIKYAILIILESVIAYGATRAFTTYELNSNRKKLICVLSNFLLAGILVFFKVRYAVDQSVIIPLGLSFYTLQAISYITDVYKGRIDAEHNYVFLLIYLSFFPTITSGPIYRYDSFVQSHEKVMTLKANYNRITDGIVYIIYGYLLKLVIAERAAIPVEKVFGDFQTVHYSSISLCVIAVLYSIRIYMDFAGYSAIVIGIAQIIGYDIPENFIAPYLSKDTKDFWNRWHVSFSKWLRDYIYIPLGGNRMGRVRKDINTLITFVISGLWHGISLHFIIWGVIHGFYRIVGDMFKSKKRSSALITFVIVTIAWLFFRLDASDAIIYIREIAFNGWGFNDVLSELSDMGLLMSGWMLLIASSIFVFFFDLLLYRKNLRFDVALNKLPQIIKDLFIIGMLLTILVLGIYGNQHDASYFIYRNF